MSAAATTPGVTPPPNVYGTPVPQSGVERTRYAAEVMRLAADGSVVEWTPRMGSPFVRGIWGAGHDYNGQWDWCTYDYRLPASSRPLKTVPWNCPADVPMPTCWVRNLDYPVTRSLITEVGHYGVDITLGYGKMIPWDELGRYDHSTDGKTWKPCTKQVPA